MGFFGFGKKNKEKEQEKMKTGLEKTRTGLDVYKRQGRPVRTEARAFFARTQKRRLCRADLLQQPES